MSLSIPPYNIAWDAVKAAINQRKHGVAFTEAATVLLDPLALTVFDAAHSETEERWFTLGRSHEGRLLAISHTYDDENPEYIRVRMISARLATSRERAHYEQ